jgi:hypothetical protein
MTSGFVAIKREPAAIKRSAVDNRSKLHPHPWGRGYGAGLLRVADGPAFAGAWGAALGPPPSRPGLLVSEPVPTGARFVDTDQRCALGLPLLEVLVEIALAWTDVAEEDNFGAMFVSDRGHGNRLFVASHAAAERARRGQEWPPRVQTMWRHQATLVFGQRTCVMSGDNRPPSKVILSRLC